MQTPELDRNGGYVYSNGGSSSSSSSTSATEDDNAAKAKERDVLLWLITVAQDGHLREDLKEPYYSDGQGGKLLKPDYVLGLTSGELYAFALGNIYRNPNHRNFSHVEILHLLGKRGARPVYSDGNLVTESDLGFNRPIRLRAHLLLIDAIMLLASKETLVPPIPSGLLLDSPRLYDRPVGKKTAFAPLPNTASWLNYGSPEESLNLRNGQDHLLENNFQSGHPQVTNIRLALEEKRRKKQGDVSKKGYEWMKQSAKFGESAFIQSGPGSQKQPEDEHLYEEISENKNDDAVINATKDNVSKRAKWNEQDNGCGGGDAPAANVYSTRQPPKPLPRRNVAPIDTRNKQHHNGYGISSPTENDYDTPDSEEPRSNPSGPPLSDSALQQFLSSYSGPSQKPVTVRPKPKVIRNPPTTLASESATFNSITNNRLRSPVIQKEFTNSIDVLNPNGALKDISGVEDEDVGEMDNGHASFNMLDQNEDSEMERKREKLMQLQQKRRSEQEAARISKEQENGGRADAARQRQEENNKKREEDRVRRQVVFESYQKKKAESKTAEDLPSPGHVAMRDNKARRARPLSVHANSINHSTNHGSFDGLMSTMKKSPSQGDIMRIGQELSILSLHNPRLAAASARQGANSDRRANSPPRNRMGTADSTSDAGSSNSGHEVNVYNGPKLFKKPTTKSNRLIVHNAIRDSCLPGIVNEDPQRKALDALARSDGCHFLVLFRDANCQFRGVYAYDPEMNDAVKVYGTGPNRIDDSMTEKLYKYNSGMKKFSVITTTHHMSVQIDGITIQSALWFGKKTTGLKAPLDMF